MRYVIYRPHSGPYDACLTSRTHKQTTPIVETIIGNQAKLLSVYWPNAFC